MSISINISVMSDNIQESENNLTNKTEGKGKDKRRFASHGKRRLKKTNNQFENDLFLRYIKEIES